MPVPGSAPTSRTILRFGTYELDVQAGELRKSGIRLKLQPQPFRILTLLLEQPGELVSREELSEKLWPAETYVEFDRSLNRAMVKLREALGDTVESPRFIETVPKRGYRFIAPVTRSPILTPEPGTVPAAPRRFFWKTLVLGLLILALGVGAYLATRQERKANATAIQSTAVLAQENLSNGQQQEHFADSLTNQRVIKSLAVLPLENLSGDPAQEYLADGMTEELIGRLAGIRNLRVISRTSVMRFKNTQLPVPQIAKMLGVDAVVEGSVMRDGNRIRVHAQLIRATTDDHLWSESYDRELHDVLALDADVAQAIASKIEVTITGEEHRRLASARSVSPEVYENYLKGRFALAKGNNKANIEESIAYFNQAIDKDPTYAPSYLGLASAHWNLTLVFMGEDPRPERPRVMQAARKALELDPELADAHVLIAWIEVQQWRWAEAETEYYRAIQLKPNDALAYSSLAWWLDCQGRTEEAIRERRHARELDPLSTSGADVGWDLVFARRYDEAVQELRSTLAVRPDNAYALWILGFALNANHQPQDAIRELEKAVSASSRSPAVIGLLANAYAQAGRRRDALRLLAELNKRQQTGYVPAAAFILAYLGLGDKDLAFVWLERGYLEQSNVLQTLKVLPLFDPIRTDPRFIDLVHRVGLDSP